MTAEQTPTIDPSIRKYVVISALLGYMALIVYLSIFVGIGNLISAVEEVNVGIYLFAIACVVISLTFHTMVWFQLLRSVNIKLSFRKTFVLYWLGVFVDNLIPGAWSGDLFKAYLLNKDPKIQSGKAVASVVAKNVYEAIFNLGSVILGLVLLFLNYTLEGFILISIGGIMLLLTMPLAILLLASFKPESAKKIIAAVFQFFSKVGRKRWKLPELQAKVEKALGDYHEGMKTLLQDPRMLIRPMILSFFAWVFEVVTLLLVFASMGQAIPLDKVVIVRAIGGNLEYQGYAFAGYAQIVTTTLYRVLGVQTTMAASVAILGGVVIFWFKTVVSYVAFHYTLFRKHNKKDCTDHGKEKS